MTRVERIDDRFEYFSRHFYSPWKVRALLRRLPVLDVRGADPDLESGRPKRRRIGPGAWVEERIAERADLLRALESLPWFTRQIVYRAYVLGDSDKHLATVLRCDRETVRRHKQDGVEAMSARLGWVGDVRAWRQRG